MAEYFLWAWARITRGWFNLNADIIFTFSVHYTACYSVTRHATQMKIFRIKICSISPDSGALSIRNRVCVCVPRRRQHEKKNVKTNIEYSRCARISSKIGLEFGAARCVWQKCVVVISPKRSSRCFQSSLMECIISFGRRLATSTGTTYTAMCVCVESRWPGVRTSSK